ncbi:ANTAR domain-containing protein [Arthrobacter sp. RIT-PI-e]|uniref:ANTAR domain-containing protein n=1 Tax=Arthrobacter sp. RIT-PI-e TaxID=1681197 RepID=UPI001364B43D|nr:ANTAR domain-containing protein [Arthrobacter sp. RIT-PI-e]
MADTVTDDAHVIGIRGFMTDLTASIHEDSHRRANEAVARSAQHRAVIEQAKGILMAVQMLTPDHAFHALSRHSQRTNRKLTDIAQNLVAATNHPTTLADMARTICAENLI